MHPSIEKLLPASVQRRRDLRRRRGTKRLCPFCEGRWAKFRRLGERVPVADELRIVGAGRRRASCPQCMSTDRERLLLLYLRERTSIFREPTKVLHVAPEKNLCRLLGATPNVDYTAGDKFEPGAPGHIMDSKLEQIDVTALPFADESFDVVLCNHVLEHVPDDRKAMSELLRVLRPQGWAVLQVPFSLVLEKTDEDPSVDTPEERKRRFGQKDHVRIYSPGDYAERLESVGFRVERDRFAAALSDADRKLYGVNPDEDLFVARRA